jgi:hypothetical protein
MAERDSANLERPTYTDPALNERTTHAADH